MATVIERTEGYYEVYELPHGKDYVWCPDCIVVECDCGQRISLTTTETICKCGADHATLVQDELKFLASSKQTPSPEDECREWKRHEDEYLYSEHNDWLEWERMK